MDIATNAIAVVGLADVVLRWTLQLYSFLSAIKDAPKEIKRLIQELTGINALVTEVKVYLEEQKKVSPTTVESQALAEFVSSLEAILGELLALSAASRKLKGSNSFANAWAKVKWVLEEKQLDGLCRRLESHKLSLVAGLQISGRRAELSHQQDMKQSLAESLNQLTSVIIDESSRSFQYMEDIQAAIRAGNTRIEVAASKLERSTSTLEKSVPSVSQKHQRTCSLSKRVGNQGSRKAMALQGLRKDIRHLTTLMGELSVVKPMPRSALRYSGGSHQSLLLSLLLLKPQLNGAISSLAMEQDLQFPPGHLNWLSTQFEILLSSVLRNVDDLSTYEDPAISPPTKGSVYGKLDVLGQPYSKDLSVKLGTLGPQLRNIQSTVVVAKFRERCTTAMVPQIERQLHSYIQISYEDSRELYDLIGYGTIREIDEAFRSSRHSPHVVDFNGRSIHYSAARKGRLDVLQYLADQGLGPSGIEGGIHALQGVCEAWRTQTYRSDDSDGGRKSLFRWLIRNGCDVTSMVLGTSLHYYVSFCCTWILSGSSNLFHQWMSLLIEEGYDLETTDHNGDTALLGHAATIGGYNVYAVWWLLGHGANPNATNSSGHNALMRSMASIKEWSEPHRFLVGAKLELLLEAGCNPNHRDMEGFTPSHYAIENSCWYEWCSALECAGLDICHIISGDRGRQKGDLNRLDVKSSKGVQAYLKWKRASSATFVYFKTSVEAIHSSDGSYKNLVEYCNELDQSCSRWMFIYSYEALYRDILALSRSRNDLINCLLAFSRDLPNAWVSEEPRVFEPVWPTWAERKSGPFYEAMRVLRAIRLRRLTALPIDSKF
ncbi:hypothetical protein MMC30_009286 [Trapelia coarctata]|nr:hypothetical protein [Trapelia coarctata]